MFSRSLLHSVCSPPSVLCSCGTIGCPHSRRERCTGRATKPEKTRLAAGTPVPPPVSQEALCNPGKGRRSKLQVRECLVACDLCPVTAFLPPGCCCPVLIRFQVLWMSSVFLEQCCVPFSPVFGPGLALCCGVSRSVSGSSVADHLTYLGASLCSVFTLPGGETLEVRPK